MSGTVFRDDEDQVAEALRSMPLAMGFGTAQMAAFVALRALDLPSRDARVAAEALREAARRCSTYNGAGGWEQALYDHGAAQWLEGIADDIKGRPS